jgi:hypothetical protein
MIVYHQEGCGVCRLHLGLFNQRQFDAHEHQWQRDKDRLNTVRWCLDDLRGIWVDTHATKVWTDMVAHITRTIPSKKSFRHAVLLPPALAHVCTAASSTHRPLARHITVLACPVHAQSWLQIVK